MKLKRNGTGAVNLIRNKVFIGLLHERFYLVGDEFLMEEAEFSK